MRTFLDGMASTRAHRALLVGVVTVVVVSIAVAMHLLSGAGPGDARGGEADRQSAYSSPPSAAATVDTPPREAPDAPDQAALSTSDPEDFATAVVEVLLTWDTVAGSRDDVVERLAAVADPTGEETPGLLEDLRRHVPSTEEWQRLSEYKTRQSIKVSGSRIPDQWQEAVAAAPADVEPGTVAVTVTGLRQRTGTWDDVPISFTAPVEITVFALCPPEGAPCRLLRLSEPSKALR